jgi:DNA-directed RNA polymerase specialized sigma24 family protein
MSKAGFQPAEIAELLGVAGQTVRNRLVEIRKANRDKETKAVGEEQ